MRTTLPRASRRGIALMTLSGLNAVALLGVSLWLITRASAQPPIMYLQMAIVGVRAFALGRAFFRYVGRLASHDSAFRELSDIRASVFERLVSSGPLRLSARTQSSIASTFVRDVDSLQDHALRFREPLWVSSITVGVTLVTVSILSPLAGLVVGIGIAFAVIALVGIDRFVTASSAGRIAELNGNLFEAVSLRTRHDAVLRAFDAHSAVTKRVAEIDRGIAREKRAPALVASTAGAIVTLCLGVVAVTVSLLRPVNDPLAFGNTPPNFTVVALIALALGEFIIALPAILDARRVVTAARGRVDAVASAQLPRHTATGLLPADITDITVSSLTARYPGATEDAISPTSFTARRGDVVLVRGPSGSGKSTLAAVLLGFLTARTGTVALSGVDIATVDGAEIRRHVGLCEQRPHIFAESLRHNLDFARDTASEGEIWAAIERVGLGDWARSRDGLETPLGESGNLVSGGQAQRVALARILLADRDIVVVDEPTANLNVELADDLMTDILESTRDRILVVITHGDTQTDRPVVEVNLG